MKYKNQPSKKELEHDKWTTILSYLYVRSKKICHKELKQYNKNHIDTQLTMQDLRRRADYHLLASLEGWMTDDDMEDHLDWLIDYQMLPKFASPIEQKIWIEQGWQGLVNLYDDMLEDKDKDDDDDMIDF